MEEIPKHACPEVKGSNPTTGLTLLWTCIQFRGNSNYWEVSQDEARRIIPSLSLRIIKSCRPKDRRNQRRPIKRPMDVWDKKGIKKAQLHDR
jgi:hypothetical protein